MLRVITVSRQFGSGGSAIARIIADRLRWRLMDREIVEEVMRIARVDRASVERCDEHLDSVLDRVLKSLWAGGFEQSTTLISPPPFDSDEMTKCARRVIEQAAEEGNSVIVGRGAQCILGHRSDTLHAFLWAPRAHRVERIRVRLPNDADPEALMDRIDSSRNAFIRREFDVNWSDHRLYDLVVNTALGDETAAACIIAGLQGAASANG